MAKYLINTTNIVTADYNEVTEVLEIEFKLKVVHNYFQVPLDEFIAFLKAPNPEDYYFKYVYCQYHYEIF